MKSYSARNWTLVLAATTVGIVLRASIAYNGSIWADEGTFLNVVAAPSWREMIQFLKYHESHPPLFYLLMRAWSHVASGNDTVLMIGPILLGAAIVPAMFVAGRELFSVKIGRIAAVLAALAPPLTEHASQFRPYGLLTLATLVSVSALLMALTNPTRKTWMLFVASTVVMLYTHNWGWLILAGELIAAITVLFSQSSDLQRKTLRWGLSAGATILVLYSLWIPSFIFQSAHAGHGSLPLESFQDYLGFLFFALSVIIETLLVGRYSDGQIVAIAGLLAAVVAVSLTTVRYSQRESVHDSVCAFRARLCTTVAVFSLITAVVLSPPNNLILPRGVATVTPMLLLAASYWIDRLVLHAYSRGAAQIAAALLSFAAVAGGFETAALLRRPRSNARKIAGAVKANSERADLLIVAPEWFAPAFDRYFPSSIEQIDYPYAGRSAMVDFSNIWETRKQSTAARMVQDRIRNAWGSNRRIWFVFEKRYLRRFKPGELERAYQNRRPDAITARDVQRIMTTLDSLYGKPQTIFKANDPQPLHDELVAYLYAR